MTGPSAESAAGRHNLNKHTRQQHEGKLVKSSERKSPITELKTNIKITNSNKQEFNKQDTSEGKVNVTIVKIDMKNLENLQDLLTQTEQENKQLKSDIIN